MQDLQPFSGWRVTVAPFFLFFLPGWLFLPTLYADENTTAAHYAAVAAVVGLSLVPVGTVITAFTILLLKFATRAMSRSCCERLRSSLGFGADPELPCELSVLKTLWSEATGGQECDVTTDSALFCTTFVTYGVLAKTRPDYKHWVYRTWTAHMISATSCVAIALSIPLTYLISPILGGNLIFVPWSPQGWIMIFSFAVLLINFWCLRKQVRREIEFMSKTIDWEELRREIAPPTEALGRPVTPRPYPSGGGGEGMTTDVAPP